MGVATCACELGYAGQFCNTCAGGFHLDAGACVLDEKCLPQTCSGSTAGGCTEMSGVVVCSCNAGYTGTYCESCDAGYHFDAEGDCVADDDCSVSDPCVDGTCVVNGGVSSCTCDPGYAGALCDSCAAGFHDDGGACVLDESCLPSSCSGAGDCAVSMGEVSCTCDEGYEGSYCDACDSGYHFEGGDCVVDEDCSASDPCVDGVCDDSGGVISCACDTGYAGDTCDSCAPGFHDDAGECVLDEQCMSNTCSGTGTCEASGGVVSCTSCDTGYDGTYCDQCDNGYHREGELCVIDEDCSNDPCAAGGTCDASGGVQSCICDVGYTGALCDSCYPGYHFEGELCVLDELCLPFANLCPSDGVCDDSSGVIQCACDPGFFECDYACKAYDGAEAADTGHLTNNSSINGATTWQSFTPTASGYLTRLEIPGLSFSGGNDQGTLKLYVGEAACSYQPCDEPLVTLEQTLVIGLNSFDIDRPFPVVAGQKYSWLLTNGATLTMQISSPGSYAGGAIYGDQTGAGTGNDINFQTYVTPGSCP